jgi:hypothetical protein
MTGTLPPPSQGEQPRYEFPNAGGLAGLVNQLKDYIHKNTEDMLPAVIVAYDRATNLATVQPAIHMVTTSGALVGRSSVASIPVLALGGGGFVVNFPLVAGSRGWIKASDRDISLYMQSQNLAAPNSARMHTFSDGLFIPDIVAGFTVAAEDVNNMVIQNLAGTVKVTLSTDTVRLKAANVLLDSETTNINGTLIINGNPYLAHVHIDGGGTGDSGPVQT